MSRTVFNLKCKHLRLSLHDIAGKRAHHKFNRDIIRAGTTFQGNFVLVSALFSVNLSHFCILLHYFRGTCLINVVDPCRLLQCFARWAEGGTETAENCTVLHSIVDDTALSCTEKQSSAEKHRT